MTEEVKGENAKSVIGEETAKKFEEKEVISKVDFAKDGSSVTIYLSLKTLADTRSAIYTLERLKFDFLDAIKLNEMNQRIAKQKERDILQAKDPMGTNARKDKNFFKKIFH